ncbi:MAG: hypothetical protein KDM63_18120, partial [Verrucomicrobiae bacterium]|nr:hypothetical protein [Verrucomicrobiae bacterium]
DFGGRFLASRFRLIGRQWWSSCVANNPPENEERLAPQLFKVLLGSPANGRTNSFTPLSERPSELANGPA